MYHRKLHEAREVREKAKRIRQEDEKRSYEENEIKERRIKYYCKNANI